MDSKVADFFKEIDALTVHDEILEEAYKNSPVLETETVKSSAKKANSEPQYDASTLGKKEAACPWQEIKDDSSGYSYYWNVNTNEVTWDIPPEYALYIQSASSGELDADKRSKKKKKESPSLPVGAIIPISYYGNSSSSEESSDVEKDFAKPSKREKPAAKASSIKKTKAKKPSKNKTDVKVSSDLIGPQLPPDFQFPVSIPLSPNETKVTDNSGNATLPKSSSSPEQSSADRLVSSPPNEMVPSTTNKKSSELDRDMKKKSSDGISKKEENGLDVKSSLQTSSAFGLRAVVDYDSFTDEEDEVSSNATSPKNTEEVKPEPLEAEPKKEEIVTSSSHLFPIVSEPKTETFNTKRKVEEDPKECPIKNEPSKKLRKNDVNIDKLFATHTTYAKHGFGFGWQNQPDDDSGFGLEPEPNSRTRKGQFGKAPIAFVKSDDVLDLNLVNDDSNLAQMSDHDDDDDKDVKEEVPSSAAVEVEMDDEPPKSTVAEESTVPVESTDDLNDKDDSSSQTIVLKGEHGDVIINKKKKENYSDEKVAPAVELGSLDLEKDIEDIDEIDRALCAAFEAKKAANSSKISPPVSKSDGLKSDLEPPSAKLSISSDSDNDSESDSEKEKERVTILHYSTEAIEKLTFLISSHTSLSTHRDFLIQFQTRFVDWQENALDTKYFSSRLGEVQAYLQNYETGSVTGDWTCQWDRVNKRYFYMNKISQVTQWTYPEDSSPSEGDSPRNSPQYKFLQKTVPESPQKLSFSSRLTGNFESSPPPPPPGVDSPPPLPPHTPPPDRLPPPPPDVSTRRDPEDMDLDNSNDFNSLPFISKKNVGYLNEEDKDLLPRMQDSPTLSPNISSSVISSSQTTFSDLNVAAKLTHSSSIEGCDDAFPWSQTSGVQRISPESSVPAETSQPAEADANSCSNTSQADSSRPKAAKTPNAGVKKEKKRKKLQLGIGLKKKNMPSLVEKWLKIKEEQEKEDNDTEVLKSDSVL